MDSVSSNVKEYILGAFLPDANPAELTESTPLISGGILDSLATVRLVSYLEDHYRIEIAAYEANVDNLDNLQLIANLVQSKLQPAG